MNAFAAGEDGARPNRPRAFRANKKALPASSLPSPRWPLPASVVVSGSRRLSTGDHDTQETGLR
jgi:hypothetical protein